jgi:hypothetical protein
MKQFTKENEIRFQKIISDEKLKLISFHKKELQHKLSVAGDTTFVESEYIENVIRKELNELLEYDIDGIIKKDNFLKELRGSFTFAEKNDKNAYCHHFINNELPELAERWLAPIYENKYSQLTNETAADYDLIFNYIGKLKAYYELLSAKVNNKKINFNIIPTKYHLLAPIFEVLVKEKLISCKQLEFSNLFDKNKDFTKIN